MSEYLDRKQVIDLYEKFQPSLANHVYEFGEKLRSLPVTQDSHGEWISKPKRVQVDETDEERIYETKLEWFCSSCNKSFGCRKPDDAFCKYCGSDNRPREDDELSRIKYFVCCPMCDKEKCVRGTEECDAEKWEKMKEGENNGMAETSREEGKEDVQSGAQSIQ